MKAARGGSRLVGDPVRHVTGGNMLCRPFAMAGLIIEKDIGFKGAQKLRLGRTVAVYVIGDRFGGADFDHASDRDA